MNLLKENKITIPKTLPYYLKNKRQNPPSYEDEKEFHNYLDNIYKIEEIMNADKKFKVSNLEGNKFKIATVKYSDYNENVLAKDNVVILFVEAGEGFDDYRYSSSYARKIRKGLDLQQFSNSCRYNFLKTLPEYSHSRNNLMNKDVYNNLNNSLKILGSVSNVYIAIEDVLMALLINEFGYDFFEIIFSTQSLSVDDPENYNLNVLTYSNVISSFIKNYNGDNSDITNNLKFLERKYDLEKMRQKIYDDENDK